MSGVVAIIQARVGSSRLPRKVLEDLGGKTTLERIIERAKRIKGVDEVVIAIPSGDANAVLRPVGERAGVRLHAGSELDVLDRFIAAAEATHADAIVRLTADCPVLDPAISSAVVERFLRGDVDYASNIDPPTYPDGLDTEVISREALQIAGREGHDPADREHVTWFVRQRPKRFRIANVANAVNLSHIRLTLDTPEDLARLRAIYAEFGDRPFGLADLIVWMERAQSSGTAR
jgi:spore coat polysaccharide biosynthesis protein SpsF (cytidylyltransferase family)